MKKIINDILYGITYALFYSLSLLPLRISYCISDFFYLIVYKVVGYRKKVVRRNLSTSFPNKTDKELKEIEVKFYHWVCDYVVESVKLLSISEGELRRRFTITNNDEIVECFRNGQSVGAILGHYCNWEWLSCVGLDLPERSKVGLVYHPIYNNVVDRLWRKIRSCLPNGVPVPKKDILRYLVAYKRDGINSIFGYIADQSPKWENIHLWLSFLNHDTPVFTGSERLMRKMNNAVYYVEMSRPKRGYYTCTYHLITKEPQSMPEHEITKRFFAMLEETIRKEPAYYLWTHNRWKRTKKEFDKHFDVVNGKVIPKG